MPPLPNQAARDVANARELYEKYRFGDFCYGQQRDSHNRLLVEFLEALPKDSRVYDIGCGSGYWSEAAVRFGIPKANLVGLDLSPQNSAALRKQGFKSACGDLLALPLRDAVSDATICNGVLHHTPLPETAFSEVVRITKPGGLIFLGVYNARNPYFYMVHRGSTPLRFVYWRWSRKILDVIYPLAALAFQPLAYLVMGKFLDPKTGKAMLADQIMTPHAHLFTKRKIQYYAKKNGCSIQKFGHSGGHMMLTAVLQKER